MPFSIVRNDIARVRADVLVNAANEQLAAGGGVCGAIFDGAGRGKMATACARIGHCPTGSAVVTPGFDLPCRWVVHAVGPIWHGGARGERNLLQSCYRSVFAEVARLGAASVAFPLISAGIFGYPVREALDVARTEATAFLDEHPDVEVTLVVFSRDVVAQGVALLGELREYVDDAYVTGSPYLRDRSAELRELLASEERPVASASRPPMAGAAPDGAPAPDELAERLAHLDASFSEALLALIDERGAHRRPGLPSGQPQPAALLQDSLQERLSAEQAHGGGARACARPHAAADAGASRPRGAHALAQQQV